MSSLKESLWRGASDAQTAFGLAQNHLEGELATPTPLSASHRITLDGELATPKQLSASHRITLEGS